MRHTLLGIMILAYSGAASQAAPAPAPSWTAFGFTLLLQLVLLGLSAAFSGSETVLFSLSPAQRQHDRVGGTPLRKLAAGLMDRPRETLMVILLGNTAVNVLIFSTAVTFSAQLSGLFGAAGAVGGALFPIVGVMFIGEVFPKVIGTRFAGSLVGPVGFFVHSVSLALGPVVRILDRVLVTPLTRVLFGPAAHRRAHALSTEEVKTLLEMSRRGGVIDQTENEFLRSVLDLNSLRVRDVMVPRVEVTAFDVNGSPDRLRELMRQTRRKRVPVCDGSIDNIVGLVYAKILFLGSVKRLRDIVMPVRFVPETASCEQLLAHFRATRTQIAVAVDEYGGMAGIVALEDVLEAIVGDINDIRDTPDAPEVVQISPHDYDVSGRLSTHYWAETFGQPRLARIATVGGLVAARLGRPPRVGDTVRIGNVELAVMSLDKRRVNRLHLRLLDAESAEASP